MKLCHHVFELSAIIIFDFFVILSKKYTTEVFPPLKLEVKDLSFFTRYEMHPLIYDINIINRKQWIEPLNLTVKYYIFIDKQLFIIIIYSFHGYRYLYLFFFYRMNL